MTTNSAAGIRVLGLAEPLARKVADAAEAALAAVGGVLATAGLTICVDDQGITGLPWFAVGDPEARGERGLVLYCCRETFFKPSPGKLAVGMAPEIWEQRSAPREAVPPSARDFIPASADSFLHHNFLFADDLLTGAVDPALVPPELLEGFQEAWSVTVDGRLDARGLPCYPRTERRGMFSRTFAAAGVLLPAHWEIFGSLWEGGLRSQDQVLGAVRRLPGL